MTPRQVFAKQLKRAEDKEQLSLSMVEWMFNDSLDASKEFLEDSHIWSFDIIEGPDGQVQAKAGILREECWAMPMFNRLPALEPQGEDYGVHQWLLFKHLCLLHAGEIRLISKGRWEKIAGPPPKGKSYWHCQYTKNDEQRQVAEGLYCRGAPKCRGVKWAHSPELQTEQMLAIGSNRICWIHDEDPSLHHWCKIGTMVTFSRLLLFLFQTQRYCKSASAYEIDNYWRTLEMICEPKSRKGKLPNLTRGKAKGKGKAKGNGK